MSSKNPQLPKVDNRYGAPMGRPEWTNDFTKPCRCFKVKFVDGDYDEGGAYWGGPADLYCATNGEGVQVFMRADSRRMAKGMFKNTYPQIKWVN